MHIIGQSKGERGGDGRMGRIGNRPYWVLSLSIVLRAIHLVGAAVVLASFLLGARVQTPMYFAVVAFASGAGLFLTEWIRHRQICRELAGVSTFVKLLLLGGAYHGLLPAQATVLVVFLLAAVAAHAPKLIRHRLLF